MRQRRKSAPDAHLALPNFFQHATQLRSAFCESRASLVVSLMHNPPREREYEHWHSVVSASGEFHGHAIIGG